MTCRTHSNAFLALTSLVLVGGVSSLATAGEPSVPAGEGEPTHAPLVSRPFGPASAAPSAASATRAEREVALQVEQDAHNTDRSGWTWIVSPSLWLSGVNGDLENNGLTSDFHKSPFDALGDGEIGLLMNVEARHPADGGGAHAGWFELYGQEIEDDRARTNGGLAADSEVDQSYMEAVYAYTPVDHPSCDFYFGVRHWYVDSDIDLDPGPSNDRDEDWTDPIVGVRSRWDLDENWDLMARGDIGGGDIADSSDFTWNVQVQAERAIDERSAWTVGYRMLSVDYERSNFEYDALTHGLITGISVRF